MLRPDLVIGIDFGTTHSGVSWAVNQGRKQVQVITDWPNPQSRISNNDKVPSALSYDPITHQVAKWGFEVGHHNDAFKWFKILLEPSHKYYESIKQVRDVNERLQQFKKTPEDLVADYLRCLWTYTLDHLRRRKGQDLEQNYELHVILTVPAVWSHLAKDRTLRAAKRAGMPEANIEMVTEPEAAALALLKEKAEDDELAVGDGLVVCDAGGGTVDLISYRVAQLAPLKIRECVIGDGDLCGSVFLDLGFQGYIIDTIGAEAFKKIKPVYMKGMLANFEFGIKRSFQMNSRTPTFSVELHGVQDDVARGIEDGTITVKATVLEGIFDGVCDKIQTLVRRQLDEMELRGPPAKAVALVGGFGESKYLFEYLSQENSRRRVRILQEPGAISAVCRGATLWGLEHATGRSFARSGSVRSGSSSHTSLSLTLSPSSPTSPPTPAHVAKNHSSFVSRVSRYSYGVPYAVPFDPAVHQHEDKFWDEAEGMWRATGQMRWFLRRGEEVTDGRVLEHSGYHSVRVGFFEKGERSFIDELYYSEARVPPTRLADPAVKKLCSLRYSIPCNELRSEHSYKSPTGKKWRNAAFVDEIVCGNANLQFRVRYNGKLVKSIEANYVENI